MRIYKDNAMYYTASALVKMVRAYGTDICIIDPSNYPTINGANTTVRGSYNVFESADLTDEELVNILSMTHGGYILKAERETVFDMFGFEKADDIHEIEVINVKGD